MRPIHAIVTLVAVLAPGPVRTDELQRCRLEGGVVSVDNFPSIQSVAIDRTLSPLDVREVGLSRSFSIPIDLAVGEKRPMGPFSLEGRRRATVQITQVSPARLLSPVKVRWLVRFDAADAFFDPCPQGTSKTVCSAGFAGGGAKLSPAPPAKEVERLEDVPVTGSEVSVASIDLVGSEGLLLLENASVAPTRIKVNLILDR